MDLLDLENPGLGCTKTIEIESSLEQLRKLPYQPWNLIVFLVLHLLLISGIAATKIAGAGVGKPINEVVCLVSILNFANRIAERIGNKKARIAGNKFGSCISHQKMLRVWL